MPENGVIGLIESGGDEYLMNKSRRNPTIGARCPTLIGNWHGIFYMPSHIDEAGHTSTKAFDYPVTQTRLDILVQTKAFDYSHTDTAGHTSTN